MDRLPLVDPIILRRGYLSSILTLYLMDKKHRLFLYSFIFNKANNWA